MTPKFRPSSLLSPFFRLLTPPPPAATLCATPTCRVKQRPPTFPRPSLLFRCRSSDPPFFSLLAFCSFAPPSASPLTCAARRAPHCRSSAAYLASQACLFPAALAEALLRFPIVQFIPAQRAEVSGIIIPLTFIFFLKFMNPKPN